MSGIKSRSMKKPARHYRVHLDDGPEFSIRASSMLDAADTARMITDHDIRKIVRTDTAGIGQ